MAAEEDQFPLRPGVGNGLRSGDYAEPRLYGPMSAGTGCDQGRPHVRPIDLSFQARGAGPDRPNYENLFADLARSGVRLTSISACPYDFGGCACGRCNPWIVTFAKLMHEIHAMALRYHPRIEMHMIGWWWSAEEHRLFADWVNRQAPGWVESAYLHILYDATKAADVRLPERCRRGAFVHIGYAAPDKPEDIYGLYGSGDRAGANLADHPVVVGPWRDGFMAYSEGVFDDVNKALLAGITWGSSTRPTKCCGAMPNAISPPTPTGGRLGQMADRMGASF